MNSWADLSNRVVIDGKSVELFIIDDLAVHEKGWGWTAIHLPTMASVAKAIPPGNHSKDALINWCRKVQELCKEEWEVMNKLTPENYNNVDENIEYVKTNLLRWCLSTKVE